MRRLMIDTGAIYALVVRNDAHHEEARQLLQQVMAQKGIFVLCDWVFAESMTLLKARTGAEVAIQVGMGLRRNPLYLWKSIEPEEEQLIWSTFRKFNDKDWSYTDCAVFVLAQQLKVSEVFAYDRHFEQMPGMLRSG